VHENVEDWTGRPGNGFFRDSLRIGRRQTSRKPDSHVILVAASDGFPISRLQLKPSVIALSSMLTLVRGATKDIGLLQIGVQRADFGRRRTKIVESPWVLSSGGIYIVPAFAIWFDNVRWRKFNAIVIGIKHEPDSNLPKITEALRDLRLLFGPRKRRKEKTRQYGDDRDDDQKFDEGETSWNSIVDLHLIVLGFAVARRVNLVFRDA